MTTAKVPRKRVDKTPIIAVASAAMFGFGPVSVGYFTRVARVSSFSASIRVTVLFFLAVYLVVLLFGFLLRIRTITIVRLWGALPVRPRVLLSLAAFSNAVSGWCFFSMLGRIDPLSAAVIMALAIVFNFFAARFLLGEEIRLTSAAGRRKWGSFVLIVSGVLVTSLSSSLTAGSSGAPAVAVLTLLIGSSSSLFAALRTVGVKGALNALQASSNAPAMQVGPALAVTRFVYLFAFLLTFLITPLVVEHSGRFTIGNLLLPNPFVAELGLVYGGAYALSYIAMSRIEASRMALITRSSIAFTALYMIIAAAVLGLGRMPSIAEATAAILVSFGAYLAVRPGGAAASARRPRGQL